jgi:hypothetical protein
MSTIENLKGDYKATIDRLSTSRKALTPADIRRLDALKDGITFLEKTPPPTPPPPPPIPAALTGLPGVQKWLDSAGISELVTHQYQRRRDRDADDAAAARADK